jgi:hypothetical protein
MKNGLLILAVALLLFAIARFFRSTGAVAWPSANQEITFCPAGWAYILIVVGFALSALPFTFLYFNEKVHHEVLAWFGICCISLVFLAPTLNGLFQMFTTKIVLTSERLEYHKRKRSDLLPLSLIQSVLIIGLEIHIKYENSKVLRIPLIFKNSRGLVHLLRQTVDHQRSIQKSKNAPQ